MGILNDEHRGIIRNLNMGRILKDRAIKSENKTEIKRILQDTTDEDLTPNPEIVQPVRAKRGRPAGKSKSAEDQSLRNLDEKSKKIRKKSSKGSFDMSSLCSALKNIPIPEYVTKSVNKILPEAIEGLYENLPRAVNFLLPFAINTMVPVKYAGMAYHVANETVVPYLMDTVIPNAVNHVVPEETRLEIARRNSLKESEDQDRGR